jgi:hypothetical protein
MAHRVLVWKPEENKPFGRPKRGWENIWVALKENMIGCSEWGKIVGSEDDNVITSSKRELSHWTLLKRQRRYGGYKISLRYKWRLCFKWDLAQEKDIFRRRGDRTWWRLGMLWRRSLSPQHSAT